MATAASITTDTGVADNVTSAEHLGIMGGSNGGLLMGVMLTQRPDLWNAVVIQVPLLDMLRYHKLLAGASWVDEYGDPEGTRQAFGARVHVSRRAVVPAGNLIPGI